MSLQDDDTEPVEAMQEAGRWIEEACKFAMHQARKKRRTESPIQEDIDDNTDDELLEMDNEKKEQLSHFIAKSLPKMTLYLMERSYNDHTALKVNGFLQTVLTLTIIFIPLYDIPELLKMYKKILNNDTKFYSLNVIEELDNPSGEWAVVPRLPQMSKLNLMLVQNFNHFGHKGGFTAIVTRIRRTDSKVPLKILNTLLKPIAAARSLLRTESVMR